MLVYDMKTTIGNSREIDKASDPWNVVINHSSNINTIYIPSINTMDLVMIQFVLYTLFTFCVPFSALMVL